LRDVQVYKGAVTPIDTKQYSLANIGS